MIQQSTRLSWVDGGTTRTMSAVTMSAMRQWRGKNIQHTTINWLLCLSLSAAIALTATKAASIAEYHLVRTLHPSQCRHRMKFCRQICCLLMVVVEGSPSAIVQQEMICPPTTLMLIAQMVSRHHQAVHQMKRCPSPAKSCVVLFNQTRR